MPSSPAKPPNIVVLQAIPGLQSGGAERTTVDIAAALSARGDCALVASAGGRMEAELAARGGRLLRLAVGAKNPAAMAANVWRLAALIRREGVDLVHARSRAAAWPALAAARLAGVPFLATYHGIYAERNAAKRLYNSVMARGDAVIANSAYTAALIRARYGTPTENVFVIPRGVDLRRFDPGAVTPARVETLRRAWGLADDARIVLQVARLTGWKGQEVLIDAAALPALAEHRDTVFVLAGDDQGRVGYRQALDDRIAGRGLAGRVRIVGHCDDVPAAMALADVAVVASTEAEAFGRAAVEAQAMGVPVVATAIGAAPETVVAPPRAPAGERTGWLVPPGDSAALAAAIAAALAMPGQARAAVAARARAQAEKFSLPAMQAATLTLYDRLVSQARHKRDD